MVAVWKHFYHHPTGDLRILSKLAIGSNVSGWATGCFYLRIVPPADGLEG